MNELLEKYSEPIFKKCMTMAMKGDRVALKLCIERLFPAKRHGYVQMSPLLRTQTIQDLAEGNQRVLQAIAHGRITPVEGEVISRILEDRRRIIENVDFQARLAALEQSSRQGGRQ
jgi:hypothetical protein